MFSQPISQPVESVPFREMSHVYRMQVCTHHTRPADQGHTPGGRVRAGLGPVAFSVLR